MKISMYSIKNESTHEFGVPFPAASEYDAKFQVFSALKNQTNIDFSSFSFVHSFIFDTEMNKMHRVGHTLCSVADLIAEFVSSDQEDQDIPKYDEERDYV